MCCMSRDTPLRTTVGMSGLCLIWPFASEINRHFHQESCHTLNSFFFNQTVICKPKDGCVQIRVDHLNPFFSFLMVSLDFSRLS